MTRTLVIARKSAFCGCALKFTVYLDDTKAGVIANGTTLEIPISCDAHVLYLKPMLPGIKGPVLGIGAGISDVRTRLAYKNSLALTPEWTLTIEPNEDAAKDAILALMCLLSSRSDSRSLYPKMEEFRQAGLDLQVNFTVRAEDILVSPLELIENRSVGESFTLNYRELTSAGTAMPLHSLTAEEQLNLAAKFEQWCKKSKEHLHLIISRFGTTVSIRLKP